MAKRILFLVAEDWYFVTHRLEFAKRLATMGYDVCVGCRFSGEETRIRDAGIPVHEVPFARQSMSPLGIAGDVLATRRLIRDLNPDILHAVALRPILVTWLASRGFPHLVVINAITGLGSLFSVAPTTLKLTFARSVMNSLLRPMLKRPGTWSVFQNGDDLEVFVKAKYLDAAMAVLIRGAGVDTSKWTALPEPQNEPPVVLFVGRLIREKGLGELIEASTMIKAAGLDHTLRVVGTPDACNPNSFSSIDIESWVSRGCIQFLGRRTDVMQQMSDANVVALPSYYREGLPRVLLEAGLAARSTVTCDVVGCREVVTPGVHGLVVPPRNPAALASAISKLIMDPVLRRSLGIALHSRVCSEFSLDSVTNQFLLLYSKAIKEREAATTGRTASG